MMLVVVPMIAMFGGLVGIVVHEAIHIVAAVVLGELEAVGWRGGVGGGPVVDYRVASRWRSEVVRKAPLVCGVIGVGILVETWHGLSLAWVFTAGATLGLLWTSPADLSLDAARAPH